MFKKRKLNKKRAKKAKGPQKRLARELANITLDPPPRCSGGLKDESNLFEWVSVRWIGGCNIFLIFP